MFATQKGGRNPTFIKFYTHPSHWSPVFSKIKEFQNDLLHIWRVICRQKERNHDNLPIRSVNFNSFSMEIHVKCIFYVQLKYPPMDNAYFVIYRVSEIRKYYFWRVNVTHKNSTQCNSRSNLFIVKKIYRLCFCESI